MKLSKMLVLAAILALPPIGYAQMDDTRMMRGMADNFAARAPKKGETAPDAQFGTSDGKALRLFNQRGKHLVLEFYTPGEVFSEKKLTAMNALREKYAGDDRVVFWTVVNRGEYDAKNGRIARVERPQVDQMREALEQAQDGLGDVEEKVKHGTVLTAGVDPGGIAQWGGLVNMAYLIGPDGKVLERWTWNDPEALELVLDGALDRKGSPRVAKVEGELFPKPTRAEQRKRGAAARDAAPVLRELSKIGEAAFLKKHDRDGDGALTAKELGLPDSAPGIKRADRNGDGKLDAEELKLVRAAVEDAAPKR